MDSTPNLRVSLSTLSQPLKSNEAWKIDEEGHVSKQTRSVADRVFADPFTYDVLRLTYAQLNTVNAATVNWQTAPLAHGTVTLLGLEIFDLDQDAREQLLQSLSTVLYTQDLNSVWHNLKAGETVRVSEDGTVNVQPSAELPAKPFADLFTEQVLQRLMDRLDGALPSLGNKKNAGIFAVAESLLRQYDNMGRFQQEQLSMALKQAQSMEPKELAKKHKQAFTQLQDYINEHKDIPWDMSTVSNIRELEASQPQVIFDALARNKETPELLQLLIEAGADLEALDSRGAPPIYMAAFLHSRGMVPESAVSTLLRAGADPNGSCAGKATVNALSQALTMGSKALAKELIAAGADPSCKDAGGQSLMGKFLASNKFGAARLLGELGGRYASAELVQLVSAASKLEPEQGIAYLEERGVDLFSEDDMGNGLLHLFANTGPLELALALVEMGLDLNRQNESGDSPLHIAAAATREVRRDVSGARPRPTLYEPIWNLETLRALAKQGGKLELQNQRGATVWHVMLEQLGQYADAQEPILAELLRDYCQPVYAELSDNAGRSLLHMVLRNGSIENVFPLIDALVMKGVDINALDHSGRSALHYMLMRFQVDLGDVLTMRAYGADPTQKSGLAKSAIGREDESPQELAQRMELEAHRQLINLQHHGSAEATQRAHALFARLSQIRQALGGERLEAAAEDPNAALFAREQELRGKVLDYILELNDLEDKGVVQGMHELYDRGSSCVEDWMDVAHKVHKAGFQIDAEDHQWPPLLLQELRKKSEHPMIKMVLDLLIGKVVAEEE